MLKYVANMLKNSRKDVWHHFKKAEETSADRMVDLEEGSEGLFLLLREVGTNLAPQE